MKFDLNLFMKEFKNPSAIMRTAPLWVWNDRMTDSQIDKSLHELKNHGFGGAVIHPRPGMCVSHIFQKNGSHSGVMPWKVQKNWI